MKRQAPQGGALGAGAACSAALAAAVLGSSLALLEGVRPAWAAAHLLRRTVRAGAVKESRRARTCVTAPQQTRRLNGTADRFSKARHTQALNGRFERAVCAWGHDAARARARQPLGGESIPGGRGGSTGGASTGAATASGSPLGIIPRFQRPQNDAMAPWRERNARYTHVLGETTVLGAPPAGCRRVSATHRTQPAHTQARSRCTWAAAAAGQQVSGAGVAPTPTQMPAGITNGEHTTMLPRITSSLHTFACF